MRKKYINTAIILFSFIIFNKIHAQTIPFIGNHGEKLDIPRISPIPEDSSMIKLLNGTWKFSNDIDSKPCLSTIEVPGEWVMQGFHVDSNHRAGYERKFTIPQAWSTSRIKLRFDAVYSEADISINGKVVGHHLGGFTPFEIDITSDVHFQSENTIRVKVKSETVADSLSSASQYAVHPLGGISRKVFLMAVPAVNLAYFHTTTQFDAQFDNAQLVINAIISNESKSINKWSSLDFELFKDKALTQKILTKTVEYQEKISVHKTMQKKEVLPIMHPVKWDPEHPALYWLKITLHTAKKEKESVIRDIGFRQIEVRGNRVFVNDHPIKLRGIDRHEVMPLRGRSLIPGQWAQDVRLFREANINYIRTSHYPPAPEFIQACDELGMFVEVEAPFCWAERTTVSDSMDYQALVQPTLEMVNTFKSNPSVLTWSMGNESEKYKAYFSRTAAMVKEFDPSRPRNFSQYGPDGDDGELEIGNQHYPGLEGVKQNRTSKRPIVFDEYSHLNAYNRLEFYTDPGVRYLWGKGLFRMWESIYSTPAILGGAIWAGIDDTFILPDSQIVGYGVWGIIDGWRRKKPEFWEVKKVYSPVKVIQLGNYDPSTQSIPLKIKNRFLFTNLKECSFTWESGKEKGQLHPAAAAGDSVEIAVKLKYHPDPGSQMTLHILDARGVVVDVYQLNLLPLFTDNHNHPSQEAHLQYEDLPGKVLVKAAETTITIDKQTGDLLQISARGHVIVNGAARLMILPMTGEGFGTQMTGERKDWPVFNAGCKNRLIRNAVLERHTTNATLKIYDTYAEAEGFTVYQLNQDGSLNVRYQYTLKEEVNPQQWGLVFSFPGKFQQLHWNRMGHWSAYPEDDIARLQGFANAKSEALYSSPAGPAKKPTWSWSQDQNALGTNDFRSTKMNVIQGTLTDGLNEFCINGMGHTDLRAWLDHQSVKLLLASYTGLGAEGFFRTHAAHFDQPLKIGQDISDTFYLQLKKKAKR